MIESNFVGNSTQIFGDKIVLGNVASLIEEYISKNTSLYEAEEQIKEKLTEEYGAEWYHKSEEAVVYLTEKAYADNERLEKTSK